MEQSACLRGISFTCFKTCNTVTSEIRFCGKISIFSVPSAIHPSVRPQTFFSLSHLLRDHWSDFSETCLRCSPRSLIVSARKWFRSVDKYGRPQPSFIFTFIASPPKPLEEFCRNHYMHLNYSQCLDMPLSMSRYARPKMISVSQKKKKKKKID